ncbi:MAG: rhodanese-like domain-containing protein [Acidimicrobiales bacterium]
MTGPKAVTAAELAGWLTDGDELALLDAREQGSFSEAHLFHAASLPLSHLELLLDRLVPRRSTRLVWCDGASELARRAADRSIELGWTDVWVLSGGIESWARAGYELYSGINVPSKAFGELVETTFGTPHISATELQRLLDDGSPVVVLDSRPMGEFRRQSIPTGIDCPGAELVYRVKEVVTDPDTTVVVNCAGRTRSIIGAQSLINAGLENRVLALENGTMGWQLAGFEPASGDETHAPDPGPEAAAWSSSAARRVAERFGVVEIDRATLDEWSADEHRTTYLLDVRTDAEFEAGHLPGSVHAPGGQLVQATDEYVATRNARLVLVDDNGVRATMTASWLRQLGWSDAVVLAGGIGGPNVTGALAKGKVARNDLARVTAPMMRPPELATRLDADADSIAVVDIGTSTKYQNRGHIPGSWWGIRSRLGDARITIGEKPTIVLTSTDGTLAKLAVAEVAALWPHAEVFALAAGNKGWRHAGYEMEQGPGRPTTIADDVWYKPYDHDADVARQRMQEYLTWEVALVAQVARDPTVSFPSFG